ncbi:MAG: hypothetical protein FWC78_07720 [Defluviitaleaceae bacterium]|nr:hypothetical protein [Defluviitaleaceae bacterium]
MKLFSVLIILLLLAACGRGGGEAPGQAPTQDINGETAPIIQPGGQLRQEGRLTILAPAHYARMINQAARNMGITIDLTTYNPDTHAEYWAEHVHNFDIFFNDPSQPLLELASAGLMADFYELINDCPRYNFADFYGQALHSLSTDGRLYFFPLGFGLQYVGINTRADVPPHIMERFMQMESITLRQMIEIYYEMGFTAAIAADPWAEQNAPPLRLANCRDMTFPGFMAWQGVNSFVDFHNFTADLTHPGFMEFLEGLLQLYPVPDLIAPDIDMWRHFRFNTRRIPWGPEGEWFISLRYFDQMSSRRVINNLISFIDLGYGVTPNTMWVGSFHYLFAVHNEFNAPINAILPFYTQAFDGFIPLADQQGRLVTNMATTFPWKTLSIVDNANAHLAWDFVSQYLLPASVCIDTIQGTVPITPALFANPNIGTNSFDMPILRHLMPGHFETMIELSQYISWMPGWFPVTGEVTIEYSDDISYFLAEDLGEGLPIAGVFGADNITQAETIQAGISRMAALHDLPLSPMPLVPYYLVETTVLNMLRRYISPQEAAAGLHETINIWLSQFH